jgi:hypothetical protein
MYSTTSVCPLGTSLLLAHTDSRRAPKCQAPRRPHRQFTNCSRQKRLKVAGACRACWWLVGGRCVPGECPTGRTSLAGGPRHPPARLGTCWEAARTPHTQHAETLPWRRALRDPWDGAGVMDDMEVDLPLPVGSARESIWEVASALDVLAGSARAGAVVASFGLDGIATVQLTEDQLHENHPRNGDANRTTQFSELTACHAVSSCSSPPLWGELS